MNIKLFRVLLFLAFSLLITTSCDKDDDIIDIPNLEFDLITELEDDSPTIVLPEGVLRLEYTSVNDESISIGNVPEGWNININKEDKYIELIAASHDTAAKDGAFTIEIKIKGASDQEVSKQVNLYWLKSFDNPKGTFVLNEGNMTTENGSLVYITPEGIVIDKVYKMVNGTELGNVAQDMAICDGKIYVISQNGNENAVGNEFDNDGMLVIMNAKTLKKEKSFSKEDLSELTWPSHIAALDAQHVYIRDNGAAEGSAKDGQIWLLDTESGALTAVEGSTGAPKSPFVKMDNKIYTYKSSMIFSYIWEISKEQNSVKEIKLPSYWVGAHSIQAAGNGQMWVLGSFYGSQFISKFDLETKKEVMNKDILDMPAAGTSGHSFVASGNNIYYTYDTSIYRTSFDEDAPEEEEIIIDDINELDPNARQFYNGLAVHPATGEIYINTIKGVGPFYTTNHIWVFDFNNNNKEPIHKFQDYTSFPAGVFFPAQ